MGICMDLRIFRSYLNNIFMFDMTVNEYSLGNLFVFGMVEILGPGLKGLICF